MNTLIKPANISESDFGILLHNWNNVTLKYNVPWDEAEEVLAFLIECYNEPHRKYHNLQHIIAFIKQIDEHKRMIVNYETVCMAAWFHDAVYDSKSEVNEEKSASLAQVKLSFLGLNEYSVNRIKQMILATKNHVALKADYDDYIFLDIDLMILGAEENEYRKYCEQIREEYNHHNKWIYTYGRKKVLNELLQRKNLYQTVAFKQKYEEQARQNMRNELAGLKYF